MSRRCLLQGALTPSFRRSLQTGQAQALSVLLDEMARGASRGASSSSSVPPQPPSSNQPSWKEKPLRWARRTRARAELATDEWRDRADEWRGRGSAWVRMQRRRLEQVQHSWGRGDSNRRGLAVNDFIERHHARLVSANQRFDDWFNSQWPLLQGRAKVEFRRRRDQFRKRLRAPKSPSSASTGPGPPAGPGPPVDVAAMVMIGAGVGSAFQGLPVLGLVFVASGAVRASWRFTIGKIDAQDMEGLFRWAPAALRARRAEIFHRLTREVGVGRAIRAGDRRFLDSMYEKRHHEAMDSSNDYTPEKLFDDAMSTLAAHPRMKEILGGDIGTVQEPDKVVYRIVEGISEVYLGWRIAGPAGGAEIQVKATASLLDFIYVFPDPRGRYGVAPAPFVIRPKGGAWSMNVDELPNDMKMPFGEKGDSERLLHNRRGVFEMDWTVRDFRHGKENVRSWGGNR